MLILRSTTAFDLDFVLEAEQAADNRAFVHQWDRQTHQSGLQTPPTDMQISLTMAHLIIERQADAKPIGYCIITDLQDAHDSLNLRRIVIVEKGQGYGHFALGLIKKFVFEEKKAHRLWLDVKEHNSRARHLYEAEGFVEEGILRECFKVGDGRYESLVDNMHN